ncbi:MAG: hypothetical protein ACOCWH_07000, partial [Spirochaetota bacterium]
MNICERKTSANGYSPNMMRMSLVKRAEKAYGKASTVHFLPIIIKIPYRILKTNAYSQLATILTIILDSDVHRTTGGCILFLSPYEDQRQCV